MHAGRGNGRGIPPHTISEVELDPFFLKTRNHPSLRLEFIFWITRVIQDLDDAVIDIAAAKTDVFDGSMLRTTNFLDLATGVTNDSAATNDRFRQGLHRCIFMVRALPNSLMMLVRFEIIDSER